MTRTKASPSPASDFAVYTAAMEIGTWHGAPIVSMIGSSTVRDLDGHYMMESALGDMARVEPNLSIWLNHEYNLPDDLFGSLIKSPEMTRDALYQDIVDLHIASDVALDNPAAARTFKYIEKGRRLGCSIGCQVTKASIDEALYEETGELALRIEGVQPVEWSVVGIPANQRSWVQNAAKGFIEKSLTRERCDPRLVQIALAEWPRETKSLVRSLVDGGRLDVAKATELLALAPARKAARKLFWDPNKGEFWVRAGTEHVQLERSEVQLLLNGTPSLTTKALAPDEEDDEFVTLDEPEEGEESGTLVPLDLDQELVDQHPEGEVNAPVPVADIPALVALEVPALTPEMANAFTPDLALAKGGKGKSKGDGAKAAQQRRAKKYHIAAKKGGNVTKPSKWKSVPDSQWGDPVNYKYPMADKAHAQNALSRWGDASNRSFYSKAEQSIVGSRIRRRARALGVSVADDSQKAYVQEGPSMDPIVQKKTKQKKQRMAPPPSTPSLTPNAPSKKKGPKQKSWSYEFALAPLPSDTDTEGTSAYVAYQGEREVIFEPVTLSAKKNGVETLAAETIVQRADAVRAAMVTLSADERKAYDDLIADAEYLAGMTPEFERQQKRLRKRAAKKARAAQAKLLIGKALSEEEKPLVDPKVAAQIEALKALAADLGVTVKSRSITLPDAEADLKREAAVFLLQRAWKIVKAGASISEKNMGQLQLAHDALVAITEGALCKGMDVQPAMQDDVIASVGNAVLKGVLTDTQAKEFANHVAEFTDALKKDEALALKQNALIKKADALSLYLAGLEQQAKNLAEMPLGRPTRANSRVVTVDPESPPAVPDATYADMLQASGAPEAPQASAEEDLLAGTEIRQVRRGSFTMTVRHWPKGWGAGARPALPAEVMPYMLMQDILGYQSDDEADVPLL